MTVSKFEYNTFTLGEYPGVNFKYKKVCDDLAEANKGWRKDAKLIAMLTEVKQELESHYDSKKLNTINKQDEINFWVEKLSRKAAVELLELGKISPELMFKITCLDADDLVECVRKTTVLSSQLNHEVQNAEQTVQQGDVVPIDQMK